MLSDDVWDDKTVTHQCEGVDFQTYRMAGPMDDDEWHVDLLGIGGFPAIERKYSQGLGPYTSRQAAIRAGFKHIRTRKQR